MKSLDDAQLVRRIAAAPGHSGDDEAELCRRFLRRVRHYGRRHLRDEHAAADLTQEVLAAVIQAVRAGRVEAPERIEQFVLGTCRFIAWRMRRGARRTDTSEDVDLELAGEVRETLDAMQLERTLAGLSAREQKVLYLAFCEDRSAQEIADRLGLTEGNVRVIRHRAMLRLRNSLD